jgi:AraC-like DNA-binding protein
MLERLLFPPVEAAVTIPFMPYQELTALAARHAVEGDGAESAIEGLRLHRCSAPTAPLHTAYRPSYTLVLQGTKSLVLGGESYRYGVGQYLLTSVELPVASWVVEASGDMPYFCLCLDLRMDRLHDLLGRTRVEQEAASSEGIRGLAINHASPELVDATTRLVRLLDTPDDIPAMAPLIEQEILYRLLRGPDGSRLVQMAMQESHAHRIASAVNWLRVNYHRPLRVEELCEQVGMSPSSFHHHFKAVTALTPGQFQKKLRLHEARRLMLVDGLDAGEAGYRVGYQSPSQFSREYARLYGMSPARDAGVARAAAIG